MCIRDRIQALVQQQQRQSNLQQQQQQVNQISSQPQIQQQQTVSIQHDASQQQIQTQQNLNQEKFVIKGLGPVNHECFTPQLQIDFKTLSNFQEIGNGSYGTIYKGTWQENIVAIKKFKLDIKDAIDEFLSECYAMEALRHPNIVTFYGACLQQPNFCIVMEYCELGSLQSFLRAKDRKLSWVQQKSLALDCAKAIGYLHQCNPKIIHRDIKSLNFLVDKQQRCKLADFGWAKHQASQMTPRIGTNQWMAPEVYEGRYYNEKADVFSFGIVLWEIATKSLPYQNIPADVVIEQVIQMDKRPDIPSNLQVPQQFIALMKECWDRDPEKRPNMAQVIVKLVQMPN
eukprot:TRINITY_DN27247_c0_g1_i1.p1 TRINITY_DN27247_c0_g1~~TRINITY_DN27247_c0_g1_i1.p1  ORF type:complete len:343 (-),score=44.88 TRINITY_DN27247_c0_g1_i1:275-1303(-)